MFYYLPDKFKKNIIKIEIRKGFKTLASPRTFTENTNHNKLFYMPSTFLTKPGMLQYVRI